MGSIKRTKPRKKSAKSADLRQAPGPGEDYLKGLLDLSCDWYWEQDEQYRFIRITVSASEQAGFDARRYLGSVPWDGDDVPVGDGGSWDKHKAALEARQPFTNFLFKRPSANSGLRYISISGQPMFDTEGRFRGYRGIAKDITAHRHGEELLALEHAVNRCLSAAITVPEALKSVMRALCESQGWECGRYFYADKKAGVLRFGEAWGVADAAIERYIAGSRDASYSLDSKGSKSRVWRTGEPLWTAEMVRHGGLAQSTLGKARDAFAFPVGAEGEAIGVLSFTSRELRKPDERLLQTVRAIGGQIGQFIQRKQAEEVLRESEERFRSLTELSSDWYWEQDANLRFTQFSGRGLSTARIDPAEWLGKTRWEMSGLVFDAAAQAALQVTLDARQPFYDFEYQRVAPDGRIRWITTSGMPIFDAAGRFTGYRGVAKDVTERRREEQLLKLEHKVTRYLADADNVSAMLKAAIRAVCETEGWACGRCYRVDEPTGVLRFAEAWSVSDELMDHFIEKSRKLTYAPGVGLIGLAWQSGQPIWSADSAKDPRIHSGIARDSGMHGAFVFPVLSQGKTIAMLIFHSREVREPDERLMQTIGVIGSQIGQFVQRKRAEEEQRRFRAAMDASADLMLLIDPASLRYIDVNDAACRALGYTREELLAMGPQDIFSQSREELAQLYERMLAGDLTAPMVEGVYRCKDGSPLPIEASPRVVRSAAGDMVVSTARDIRERSRAEKLLALEHTVARNLVDAESLEAGLKSTLRAICETQNWDCARYLRVDEKAGLLRFGEDWSVPNARIKRYLEESRSVVYGRGVGLVGRVWQSGQPIWVSDTSKDPRTKRKDTARKTGLHAGVYLPVVSGERTVGVFAFNSREVREPDERLLRTVRVIGSQIGQFLKRKQAEDVVRESEERFRSLTGLSSDWFWEQDSEFRFTRFEGRPGLDQGENITGIDPIGKRYWETGVEIEDAGGWEAHRALLQAHQSFRDVAVRSPMHPDGKRRYFSLSGEPIFDPAGRFTGYRGVAREITERKQAEERIQYLATHDGLTDLPNREMFNQLLNLAIQSARRYGRHFAVLFLDLDRFKVINDTLGHEAGDKLLREVAGRLKENVRASDVVARLGGDEFVVLLQEVTEAEQVAAVARKLLAAVMHPVVMLDQECRVTASVGISMYPRDGEDEQVLMKSADIAMYLAKEEGKNNFQFYSKDIKAQSLERLALESSLRRALEREEFFLHYQAKLDLDSGAITGVEALLRWKHPDLGLVSPAQFIPLAEETGMIVPIGKWVLKTACAQSVAWQRAGLPPLCIAVNLSPRQFADENLLQDLAAGLQETGLAPEYLELEITESMVMGNVERAAKKLAAIKQMGVRLAIDDFGTGYSSLAQIKRFPIDTIKVDRSFIREIPQNSQDKAITEAIIAMGRSLSLTVVAEGVETQEQQAFLREHACNEMQGYYFSKPIAPDQFAELLRTHAPIASPKRQTHA